MPTATTISLLSASSPIAASTAIQQTSADIGAFLPGQHSVRLESSLGFSLVLVTIVLGLVAVRHFVARDRNGPLAGLS